MKDTMSERDGADIFNPSKTIIWVSLVDDSKESAWNAGAPGSTPGLGRSSGEANGYPL